MRATKIRVLGAFAALLTLALAASCEGFFVNPTLTSVSVGPQNLSLNINATHQMTATGTYSDGTQKTLNSGVTWSSSDSTAVTVGQSSGVVTGVASGSATITGSAGSCSACSGSTTVTVALQGVTSITVTPSSQSATRGGSTVYFTAKANNSTDITNPSGGATWTVSLNGMDQTSNFNPTFLQGSGEGFTASSSLSPGAYTVTATYGGVAGTATLNVN